MNTRAKKYFAINIVLLLMIASIYLATNAAMLQNVFAQVGQSPIYKGNSEGIAFLLSGQEGKKEIAEAAKLAMTTELYFALLSLRSSWKTIRRRFALWRKWGMRSFFKG